MGTVSSKLVFLNIVDGTSSDYLALQNIFKTLTEFKDYKFIIAPKQIQSISLVELKNMIEEVDDKNDKTDTSGKD